MKFKSYGQGEVPGDDRGPRPYAYDYAAERAREAAIERGLCMYIPLKCGHYTTWEVDEQFSAWRPKRSSNSKPVFFCEMCGSWEERVPKYKKNEYPDEPLF